MHMFLQSFVLLCLVASVACASPTVKPILSPSKKPSSWPSSIAPSKKPSTFPTASPSASPVVHSPKSSLPTTSPSASPVSHSPKSTSPTIKPTTSPSTTPVVMNPPKSGTPTTSPSAAPVVMNPPKSGFPTASPSAAPVVMNPPKSGTPTTSPSATPVVMNPPKSGTPTASPTKIMTTSVAPSKQAPSSAPHPAVSSIVPSNAHLFNNFEDTVAPTASNPTSTSCQCQYTLGCASNSDCCPGLACNIFVGYSQCLADVSLVTSSCVANYKPCSSTSPCCSGLVCRSEGYCDFPCSIPGYSAQSSQPSGEGTTISPSSMPIVSVTSNAPVSETSTESPTNFPVIATTVPPAAASNPSNAPVAATTTTPTVIGTTTIPISPTIPPSSLAQSTYLPTYSNTAVPSSAATSGSCMCQYATGCSATNGCCAGLQCNYFTGFSQCLADPTLVTPSCAATYAPCSSPSQCCSGRVCTSSGQCDFACEATPGNNNPQPTQPTAGQCNNPVPAGAVTGPVGYISRKGNQLVDKNGKVIRISGVNWTGFEGYENRPDGLHKRSYKDIIKEVQGLGFNTFRFPFSNSMIRNKTAIWIDYYQNPDLVNKTPLQVMDTILTYCNSVGMAFILDRHSCLQADYPNEHFWYLPGDPFYTEEQVKDDFVFLANRYQNLTYFLGFDLWNEPKADCVWADWACAAGRFGNAILAANPNLLVIVEGTGDMTWWSGNLEGVANTPVVLSNPSKLVYSVHDYGTCVFNQTWFWVPGYPQSLQNHWNKYWGYILTDSDPHPVLIGELGCPMTFYKDLQWIDMFTRYLNGDFSLNGVNQLSADQAGVSWLYWNLSPGSDTGGIYNDDWHTFDLVKLRTINGYTFGSAQNIFGSKKLF